MKNASTPSYVVRQPRNVEELEALLRLRYSVFEESPLRFMLRENEYGLDVDAWDKQAWHIGLYKQTGESCEPVGYMRFIHNRPERSMLVDALAKKYPALGGIIAKVPNAVYPFTARAGNQLSQEMLKPLQGIAPGKLVEVSRFSLKDSDKNHLVCRFIIESAMAICHLSRDVDFVFEVAAHHATCYQRFGYHAVANRNYDELPWVAVLMHSSANELKEKKLSRLHQMAEAFEDTQSIWLHPDEPGNFYPSEFIDEMANNYATRIAA